MIAAQDDGYAVLVLQHDVPFYYLLIAAEKYVNASSDVERVTFYYLLIAAYSESYIKKKVWEMNFLLSLDCCLDESIKRLQQTIEQTFYYLLIAAEEEEEEQAVQMMVLSTIS